MYSSLTKKFILKKKKAFVLKKDELLSSVTEAHINPSHVVEKCGEVRRIRDRSKSTFALCVFVRRKMNKIEKLKAVEKSIVTLIKCIYGYLWTFQPHSTFHFCSIFFVQTHIKRTYFFYGP